MNIDAIRHLYPFESHWLDLDGPRMHYVDEGRGEPVLMVHGNPTWSFYFRELIKDLRSDFRCIAPDHIGCGLSDKPGDDGYDYRLHRRIDDLCRLIDTLDLPEKFNLVLHDWGGMIGMGAALRFPERINRVVLLNTAAFLLPENKHLPVRLWLIRNLRWLFAPLMVRGLNAFALGASYMAVKQRMSPEVRRAMIAPYDSWQNRIATLRFVQDIPLDAGHPSYATAEWVDRNLHQMKGIPKMICWGRGDFVFDDDFLNEWRKRFPGAETHVYENAGHYVLEDVPHKVVPQVRDFLTRTIVPDPQVMESVGK